MTPTPATDTFNSFDNPKAAAKIAIIAPMTIATIAPFGITVTIETYILPRALLMRLAPCSGGILCTTGSLDW
jgi:hypothetical protein